MSEKPVPRDDQWSSEDVARIMCNPAHVFNGTIAAEQWVQAMVRLVENANGDVEGVYRRIMLGFDEALGGRGRVEETIADDAWPSFQKLAQETSAEIAFRQLLGDLTRGAEIILASPKKGGNGKRKKKDSGERQQEEP